jgi:hypothetical protein
LSYVLARPIRCLNANPLHDQRHESSESTSFVPNDVPCPRRTTIASIQKASPAASRIAQRAAGHEKTEP